MSNKLFYTMAAAVAMISSQPLAAEISGASPGLSGAPGDSTCLSCHGTRANSNGGSVTITSDGGTTYTPGQKSVITVTIKDSTAKAWGFEASPRVTSSPSNTGAGTISPGSDGYTQMSGSSGSLQWITHTQRGVRNGTTGSATFTFNWTPTKDFGNVDFYVAANAANGNGNADSGDHIYTSKLTLTSQVVSTTPKPAIAPSGVVNAFSGASTGFSPGTWVTIYGSNLAPSPQAWGSSNFVNNVGPQTLNGVSATVNGKAAVLNYVSAGQVNIQIPTDAGTGASAITVTNANGTSNAYSMSLLQFSPTLNQNASFTANGKNYAVAQFPDGTFVGPTGLIPGAPFRPAQAGDTIIIFGLGFGALQTPLSTGQVATSLDATANPVTFKIGTATVTPTYAGAAPNFVGAYQINLVIPSNAGTGDVPIDATVGGTSTGQSLYITLQ